MTALSAGPERGWTAFTQWSAYRDETEIAAINAALIEQLDHCGMDDASIQHECKSIRDIILGDSRGKDLS